MTTPDWQDMLSGLACTEIMPDAVRLDLDEGRTHVVRVIALDEGWALSGRSASPATMLSAGLDAPTLWSRNRHLDMVGYAVAADGYAEVRAWLPYVGTTPEEFAAVTREVAVEADRLEFFCSGQDLL